MPFAFLMHDPLAGTLMLLALLWLSAKLGGELAVRLKLPAVTGELAVGLALTALHRAWPLFPDVAASPATELLGGLGVVVLMFARRGLAAAAQGLALRPGPLHRRLPLRHQHRHLRPGAAGEGRLGFPGGPHHRGGGRGG